MTLRPIILCGGSGSRLWPLSRGNYPKHLLPLIGDKTLLQQTAERLVGLNAGPLSVVTNAEHAFLVSRQLGEVNITPHRLIIEPIARGTAPAIALAALDIAADDPDAVLLIAPSDHLILKTQAFATAVEQASGLAERGFISTIGVTATAPETGYGYIQQGEAVATHGYAVDKFVEKPDKDSATLLIESGRCTWNSGIFISRASTMIEEMEKHAPTMLSAIKSSINEARYEGRSVYPSVDALRDCPSDSIDYAVMEPTDRAAVVPADLGWSDLGSWSALWQVSEDQDENGNVLIGDVTAVDTRNCYVRADGSLVAVVGVENLVVVTTGDAVVVASRERSEDIKSVVDQLKDRGRQEVTAGPTVQGPWGNYTLLQDDPPVRVRRLLLVPGGRFDDSGPLRRVAWTVVLGEGQAEIADQVVPLKPGDGLSGSSGSRWSLVNTGSVNLELIEVARPISAEHDQVELTQ